MVSVKHAQLLVDMLFRFDIVLTSFCDLGLRRSDGQRCGGNVQNQIKYSLECGVPEFVGFSSAEQPRLENINLPSPHDTWRVRLQVKINSFISRCSLAQLQQQI